MPALYAKPYIDKLYKAKDIDATRSSAVRAFILAGLRGYRAEIGGGQ